MEWVRFFAESSRTHWNIHRLVLHSFCGFESPLGTRRGFFDVPSSELTLSTMVVGEHVNRERVRHDDVLLPAV